MEISSKITSTAKESTDGLTEEFTEVSGSTTRWREKEPSLGVTEEDTSECIRMIKSTVTVPSSGQMVVNTSENGVKANNTARESTLKKESAGKESGRWVKESNGSKKTPNNEINLGRKIPKNDSVIT